MNYNPYLYNQNNYQTQNQFQPNFGLNSLSGINPQSTILGRTVNAFNEITANDVPMNGMCAYFPKADMSEISVRKWNNNGTISQTVYKPVLEPTGDKTDNLPSMELESQYKAISERLDRIERMLVPWRRGEDYDAARIDTENSHKQQSNNAKSDVRQCGEYVQE